MRQRFLRFLISGGSAAAVEYTAFFLLQATLGPSWLLTNQSLSFACGFVVSFLLNRHWVFHSEGKAGQELLKYGIVAGINLAAGNLAMLLMVGSAGMYPLIAKFLVMGMIAAWNYLVFSRLVFSDSAAQR
ncbi:MULTISPECIES: GtrA family protein [Stenotrophomonas]|uniref:GtrA family protein n=1 Tax=Stenotrophomonas TaxID=40323 RepID=UPI00088A7B4B|nr:MULTISPECIES: GtrA family protein [Stenotrophomonas]MBH1627778.1 GtrA family protein [Stenotrophomonas maltophilia]MDA3307072.1 GtrA family protein [Stenotrophomonas sp. PI_27]PNY75795.1 GtrA family protein [Stenotrophomonas pavanii]WGS56661.1 GtrA family protein [Stenotrophomonas pavanii]SDK19585.1 Putative flippase GtrA (transmembrane translocase of bactoprenol-linked glucose) [Stenotrophomonas pavanii]